MRPGILEHSFSSPVSLGVTAEKRQCNPRKEGEAAETQVEEKSGLCPEMEAEGGEKGPARDVPLPSTAPAALSPGPR